MLSFSLKKKISQDVRIPAWFSAALENDPSRGFFLQAGAELGKAKREAGDYFSPLFLQLACASQKNANVHVFMKALEFISFAKKRN